MSPLHRLCSPLKIGTLEVPNRIVMAPIGNGLANSDGTVSEKLIDFYEARAKGGVGLIILGSVSVDSVSPFQGLPEIWDDKFIPGLQNLTAAMHRHGTRIFPQLCHAGGMAKMGDPLVPSSFSLNDIKCIIALFSEAAVRSQAAGFDGVEIHAAHGWMVLGSFITPLRNNRNDAYGESPQGYVKLLLEVIRSIRAATGSNFPITVRFSADELIPGGLTLQETRQMAPLMFKAGADAFNVSAGLHGGVIMEDKGPFVACSRAIKEVVNVPVMVVNKIIDPRDAEAILERNEADLVVMARALLADPELPAKAAADKFDDIAPCVGCGACRSRPGVLTCLVNPALTREKEFVIVPALKKKKVLVAGGGPGGLMAAATAALRGHDVTLCEKEGRLGGQFRLAAVPPTRQEINKAIRYLVHRAEQAGVKIQLNTEVTPELVGSLKPDAVIVATGGEVLIPDIPGVNGKNIVTAYDILDGKTTVPPGNIAIIGGGLTGCEVADFVTDRKDDASDTHPAITIIEMQNDVAQELGMTDNRALLLQRLEAKKVKILTSAIVREFQENSIVFTRDGREESTRDIDTIVLAMGVKPYDRLSAAVKNKVAEIHVIGDAGKPGRAVEAIAEGAETGRRI